MACLGVHFALTEIEVKRLLAIHNPAQRLEHLKEEIEERLFNDDPDRVCETDKAWDAIHRALTDGSLRIDRSDDPSQNVILGGRSLYDREDYIMTLKMPAQVREIAALLRRLTEHDLRRGYGVINAEDYGGEIGDQDFEYTWEWFQPLREFYERAATAGHNVLFTVDQ